MAERTVEDLQGENAELRARLDHLRNLLDSIVGARSALDVIGPETKSRMINAMTPAEIAPHLREVAMRCIKLSRGCADESAARELEDVSIELADRSGSLEAVFKMRADCE